MIEVVNFTRGLTVKREDVELGGLYEATIGSRVQRVRVVQVKTLGFNCQAVDGGKTHFLMASQLRLSMVLESE